MEFSTIEEILSCPVCQEISVPPIYQCSKGHIICKDCIQKLSENVCPVCRTCLPFEKIRSLATERLAEMLDIKCKNHAKGCPVSTKSKDMDSHLENCEFREALWCQKLGSTCVETYTLPEFSFHCKAFHAGSIQNLPVQQFTIEQEAATKDLKDLKKGKMVWSPLLFQGLDDDFFILTSNFSPLDQIINWDICYRGLQSSFEEEIKHWKVMMTVETDFGTITRNTLLDIQEDNNSPFMVVGNFSVKLQSIFAKKDFTEKTRISWKIYFTFPVEEKEETIVLQPVALSMVKRLDLSSGSFPELSSAKPNCWEARKARHPYFADQLLNQNILGRFEWVSDKNFEDFLQTIFKAFRVGVYGRMLLKKKLLLEKDSSMLEITERYCVYTMKSSSTSFSWKFGEEFDYNFLGTPTFPTKCIVLKEGETKLVHVMQNAWSTEIKSVYTFTPAEMTIEYFALNATATKVYKRL